MEKIKKLDVPKDIMEAMKKDANSTVFKGDVRGIVRHILISHYRSPKGKCFLTLDDCYGKTLDKGL